MFDSFADLLHFAQAVREFKIQIQGTVGESYFAETARNNLKQGYHILNDVVLKAPNGTTQIDQIIISQYGIFVVEIKFRKGWIF